MSLRIPLTKDQTLQTEFHEIERRLRKLERQTGVTVGSNGTTSNTTFQTIVQGGATNLDAIYARLAVIEEALRNLSIPEANLPELGPAGPDAQAGIAPDPGTGVPPTGVAQHLLVEDATWGFPFRGLMGVTTVGDSSGPGQDAINVEGTLNVNADLTANRIEARSVTTLEGVTLESDTYQLSSDERGLVRSVTDGTQTQPPCDVVSVLAGLHCGDVMASDVVCHSLYTYGNLEYGDTFWEDLRFPATGFNPAGSTAPPSILTTNGLLSFSGTADNIIGGVAQMPHSWKEGTELHAHIHLAFPTAATANTRWKLEYNVASVNGDFTTDTVTYTTLATVTIANANNVARHVLAELGIIPMTGKTVSACVLWRLTRLAASDGADNDTNACTLIEFDLHYERSSPGSSSEYVK